MFFGRWSEREDAIKVDHTRVDNGREGKTYNVNDVVVTVWSDGEVTGRRERYAQTDPKSTLPGIEVSDGVLSIPLEDIAGLILSRCSPLELAEGLVSDDETREQLLECLARRYTTPELSDQDRRLFLAKVQAEVHAVALDLAITRMNHFEDELRSRSSTHRWKRAEARSYRSLWNFINERELNEIDRKLFESYAHPDKIDKWLCDEFQDPIQRESVGREWRESRDYWRDKLLERFAAPEIPREEEALA